MIDLHHVTSEEGWTGLYVDGKLVLEGHSLRVDDVLDLVLERGGVVRSVGYTHLDGACNAHLEDVGNLPSTIDELMEWPS